MNEEEREVIGAVTVIAIKDYSDLERELLLNWALQVTLIRNSSASYVSKITQITRVTNELGVAKQLVQHYLSEYSRIGRDNKYMALIRRKVWDERGVGARGLIAGAATGLVASLSAPMAGLAIFGGAMAIPVFMVGAGVGNMLATLIEELSRKKQRERGSDEHK